MLQDVAVWGWKRLRPAEGWFSFFLLLAIILTLTWAVVDIGWVPETTILPWLSIIGFLLSTLLSYRPVHWLLAWALITSYGLLSIAILLGQLLPVALQAGNWFDAGSHIRQNLAILSDRVEGWFAAVSGGGSSRETIVFALILALLAWFLPAYAGWSISRQRRPYLGLTVLGAALAFNSYFGDAPIWSVALFIGLATLLAASLQYARLERRWNNNEVDYSTEIRLDALIYGTSIALFLVLIAFFLPAINIRALSQLFLEQPAVQEAEQAIDRAFAGVRQPRGEKPVFDLEGNPGRAGTLPRSFLLGAPPELYETVVFTATTSGETQLAAHWRGYSYDIYTGRGWAISTERQQPLAAGEDLPLPAVQRTEEVDQSVFWADAPLATRYTLGLPTQFDQGVLAFWRGVEDLSRVRSSRGDYTAFSRVSQASVAELRSAELSDVPPAIMARYTALPESVPERVVDLAQQIAGLPTLSPYDQARALERFLRQYPYSLDLDLPPSRSDPVDYFLFELQAGYCDYYTSAMVVMARSLGLPARLAAGFLAQPSDEKGVQTIYQINAHSWPEVYFAGYGWIEFEPTAAFPSDDRDEAVPVPPEFDRQEPLPITYPPPIPERVERSISPFWYLAALLMVGFIVWWIWSWRQARMPRQDRVRWAYGKLLNSARQLGLQPHPGQTPSEFEEVLLDHLTESPAPRWSRPWRLDVQPDIVRLSSLFIDRQYGGKEPDELNAAKSWHRIRGRMGMLAIVGRIFRKQR